jgi:hypothetical protein
MPPRPDLAAVVQEALAHFLPGRTRAVETDRIQALDLDAAQASIAFDPQHLARDFGKSLLLDRYCGPCGGARVPENALPVSLGKGPSGGGSSILGVRSGRGKGLVGMLLPYPCEIRDENEWVTNETFLAGYALAQPVLLAAAGVLSGI